MHSSNMEGQSLNVDSTHLVRGHEGMALRGRDLPRTITKCSNGALNECASAVVAKTGEVTDA